MRELAFDDGVETVQRATLHLAKACSALMTAIREVERRRSGAPGTLLTTPDLDKTMQEAYKNISDAVDLLDQR